MIYSFLNWRWKDQLLGLNFFHTHNLGLQLCKLLLVGRQVHPLVIWAFGFYTPDFSYKSPPYDVNNWYKNRLKMYLGIWTKLLIFIPLFFKAQKMDLLVQHPFQSEGIVWAKLFTDLGPQSSTYSICQHKQILGVRLSKGLKLLQINCAHESSCLCM